MNKRVLVTAGASGIGLAIADCFLAAGCKVHIGDLDQEALRDASARLGVSTSLVDVGEPAEVALLAEETLRALGGVDVIVNNAGIGGPRAPVDAVTDEDWDRVLRVNLSSMFFVTRALVPWMKEQRSGAILNISTSSVGTGLPGRSPYVVSKAGVEGLTRNLARELGPYNIRCNSIRPGSIENERGRALLRHQAEREGMSYEEALQRRLGFISMRSRVSPSEVGDMAVFLASDAARHVSGQCVSVCGNIEWEG